MESKLRARFESELEGSTGCGSNQIRSDDKSDNQNKIISQNQNSEFEQQLSTLAKTVSKPHFEINQSGEPEVSLSRIRFAAMSLLARREHSQFELKQKLNQRFRSREAEGDKMESRQTDLSDLIQLAIQQLADEALQCDTRFTESFTAMRIRKGQGPVRIEKELELRRVEASIIAACLATYESEWPQLAKKAWCKKYGRNSRSTTDIKEKARQIRFLQYRGFLGEHIQSIWKEQS